MGVWLLKDTSIRLRAETKLKLDSLDFARKNISYNDIVEKLILEYSRLNKVRGGR